MKKTKKIQLILDLANKIFFNDKIKQNAVFYYMNPFGVLYLCKIEETLYTDKISLKQKQNRAAPC